MLENAELCAANSNSMWNTGIGHLKLTAKAFSSEDILASLTSLERHQRDECCKFIWAYMILIFLS